MSIINKSQTTTNYVNKLLDNLRQYTLPTALNIGVVVWNVKISDRVFYINTLTVFSPQKIKMDNKVCLSYKP